MRRLHLRIERRQAPVEVPGGAASPFDLDVCMGFDWSVHRVMVVGLDVFMGTQKDISSRPFLVAKTDRISPIPHRWCGDPSVNSAGTFTFTPPPFPPAAAAACDASSRATPPFATTPP